MSLPSDPAVMTLLDNPYRPPLDGPSAPFWAGGRDGVLRIAACADCGTLIYPFQPMCPRCRSRQIGWREMSGQGAVVAFTINHQGWQPWMRAPFVIAHVELVEQEGLWLLTNVIGSDPEDVAIGMRVTVDFVPRDGYWLPVFKPVKDPRHG